MEKANVNVGLKKEYLECMKQSLRQEKIAQFRSLKRERELTLDEEIEFLITLREEGLDG